MIFKYSNSEITIAANSLNRMQRVLNEKNLEEMRDYDIVANNEMTSMTETIHAFIKCGAIASFRKMLYNMSADDRNKLIEKLGSGMLAIAIRFRRIEFVKELLQYNIDINCPYPALKRPLQSEDYPFERNNISYLDEALYLAVNDCERPVQSGKSLYEEIANIISENSEDKNDCKIPPYQETDFDERFKADNAIISLLIEKGADPDIHGHRERFDAANPPKYIKGESLPTMRETCNGLKQELVDAGENLISDLNSWPASVAAKRHELLTLLDKIISAPASQPRCASDRNLLL